LLVGRDKDVLWFKLRITLTGKYDEHLFAAVGKSSSWCAFCGGTIMKLQIQIDNQMYEVEVEVAEEDYPSQTPDNQPAPAAATIQSTVLRTPPKPGASLDSGIDESKLCRSPLAGIVVRVAVAPGQELQVNDLMVMLEAMKMETAVTAPVGGTLKSVHVAPGDSVKANQVLAEFD
jgi:biotin carboxyl carrier protein